MSGVNDHRDDHRLKSHDEAGADGSYRFVSGERRPVEVLVFSVDPEHLDEFLAVDHEVWTLGEALRSSLDHIGFLSKEVWLDESRPGEVTLIFVWDTMADWDAVGDAGFQQLLQAEFDARFPHRCDLIKAWHEDANMGLYRVSRFERT